MLKDAYISLMNHASNKQKQSLSQIDSLALIPQQSPLHSAINRQSLHSKYSKNDWEPHPFRREALTRTRVVWPRRVQSVGRISFSRVTHYLDFHTYPTYNICIMFVRPGLRYPWPFHFTSEPLTQPNRTRGSCTSDKFATLAFSLCTLRFQLRILSAYYVWCFNMAVGMNRYRSVDSAP